MELLDRIRELQQLGEEGEKWYTKIPTPWWHKTILDAEEFFAILQELESSFPEEMTTAAQVSRERERIVREAHEERAKILEAAREQAQRLISNDELVLQARRRADEILEQARIEGDAIRAEAEAWARGLVERLENYISRIAATVDKTKKALTTQSQAGGRADSRVIDQE